MYVLFDASSLVQVSIVWNEDKLLPKCETIGLMARLTVEVAKTVKKLYQFKLNLTNIDQSNR